MPNHRLRDTNDLRQRLINIWSQHEAGTISNAVARTRAILAREILDTIKVEIVASRTGLTSFAPVSFQTKPQIIDVSAKKRA